MSNTLSPQARQKLAANAARDILAEAQQENRAALGMAPPYQTFVDGREGAPLESVNPDRGHIVFEFELIGETLAWIGEQLIIHSPVLTGAYQKSHILLADGVEINVDGTIPPAENYVFVNTQPYARKIERGLSEQAADGVYEVVTELAKRRFGNAALIRFTYISPTGGAAEVGKKTRQMRKPAIMRQPAIRIIPR